MRIGPLVLLALSIEAVAVLALVLMVALFGPTEPIAAQEYAERLGNWVGPLAGFVLCLGGGWLVARHLTEGHVKRGLLLGAMVAAIDLAILVASGAAFQVLFAFSNLGRLVAGSIGGLLASRSRTQQNH